MRRLPTDMHAAVSCAAHLNKGKPKRPHPSSRFTDRPTAPSGEGGHRESRQDLARFTSGR